MDTIGETTMSTPTIRIPLTLQSGLLDRLPYFIRRSIWEMIFAVLEAPHLILHPDNTINLSPSYDRTTASSMLVVLTTSCPNLRTEIRSSFFDVVIITIEALWPSGVYIRSIRSKSFARVAFPIGSVRHLRLDLHGSGSVSEYIVGSLRLEIKAVQSSWTVQEIDSNVEERRALDIRAGQKLVKAVSGLLQKDLYSQTHGLTYDLIDSIIAIREEHDEKRASKEPLEDYDLY